MHWTMEQIFGDALRAFRRNWLTLTLAPIVIGLIGMLPAGTWAVGTFLTGYLRGQGAFKPSTFAWVMLLPSIMGSLLLLLLFGPAMTRMSLAALRDQRPRLSDIFDFRRAGTFMLASLAMGLIVFSGFICLIVPGWIALTGLVLVPFFVLDGPEDRAIA